ncbi:MAG: hypothetical protein AAB893_01635 [Patescibacteria group bacterium]
MRVVPTIGEHEIRRQLEELSGQSNLEEEKRSEEILIWINGNKEALPVFGTCSYRNVEAFARTSVDVNSIHYTFGAVGSSGGHEFMELTHEQEMMYMCESIVDALVSRGFIINRIDEAELTNIITETAYIMLRNRGNNFPNAWAPNCLDLTNMANKGAESIASLYSVVLSSSREYHTCLMHKYSSNGASYSQQDLNPPGVFGRQRCPSNCAESQAIFRTQMAYLIPLTLGIKESYLVAIENSETELTDGRIAPCSDLVYLIPTDNGAYLQKKLIIDNRLGLNRMWNGTTYKFFSYLFSNFEGAGIDTKNFSTIKVVLDEEHVIAWGMKSNGEKKFLLKVPLTKVGRTETVPFSMGYLWTSAAPCVHCLNVMSRYGVENLHIDSVSTDGLKGDDWLVLEYLLTNFKGKLSVGNLHH